MIKNIIFDFGDIFINLDKLGTYKELSKLGVSSVSEDMISIYHQYEKGLISTGDFVDFYQQKFPHLKSEELIFSWNAVLKDFPKYRLDFIKELAKSKEFRLFLLSNTNDLHINWIQENWGIKMYNEFKKCFEQFYLSHEINFRKPDTEIYEFVLNENNLKASETLFVDDLNENTVAAENLGINTWNLIPDEEDVVDLFTKNAILF